MVPDSFRFHFKFKFSFFVVQATHVPSGTNEHSFKLV